MLSDFAWPTSAVMKMAAGSYPDVTLPGDTGTRFLALMGAVWLGWMQEVLVHLQTNCSSPDIMVEQSGLNLALRAGRDRARAFSTGPRWLARETHDKPNDEPPLRTSPTGS